MTDFPAVVYLKADIPSKGVDISKKEDHKCGNGRRTKRKIKGHKSSIRSRKRIESYKKLLEAMNNAVLKKIDKIEGRLDELSQNCDILEEKVDTLTSLFDSNAYHCNQMLEKSAGTSMIKNNVAIPFTSKVTQITLNAEGDFPTGSWLGFENNPEMRVRCKISPRDLHQINRKCVTPEKMALVLLDLLFDRETQACSNVSGLGKHKKKQLDPLLIYGIRCSFIFIEVDICKSITGCSTGVNLKFDGHLIHRFDITENDWTKVKIHIDSKCRTAFRRKLKGMSLSAKKHVPSCSSDCLDLASRESRHSNSSNVYSGKEMNSGDFPLQGVDDGNNGNALKTLMQIILSEH